MPAIRVEICGGIASGKTTLATLLQDQAACAKFEDFSSNPFWRLFYEDPKRVAFETEITFMMQHYSMIKSELHCDGLFLTDFSILQDLAYADVTLSRPQLNAFFVLYQQVVREIGEPKILLHLSCSPQEQLKRIRARARQEEANIEATYLKRLNEAIDLRVSKVSRGTHVANIDSQRVDFAHVASARTDTLNAITEILSSI